MLGRLFASLVGPDDTWSTRHYPAANTAAVVERPAVAGSRAVVTKAAWSYRGTPGSSASLTVADSVTTLFKQYITAGGPGAHQFGTMCRGAVNSTLTITLSTGGAGITGTLTCEGIYERETAIRWPR